MGQKRVVRWHLGDTQAEIAERAILHHGSDPHPEGDGGFALRRNGRVLRKRGRLAQAEHDFVARPSLQLGGKRAVEDQRRLLSHGRLREACQLPEVRSDAIHLHLICPGLAILTGARAGHGEEGRRRLACAADVIGDLSAEEPVTGLKSLGAPADPF